MTSFDVIDQSSFVARCCHYIGLTGPPMKLPLLRLPRQCEPAKWPKNNICYEITHSHRLNHTSRYIRRQLLVHKNWPQYLTTIGRLVIMIIL